MPETDRYLVRTVLGGMAIGGTIGAFVCIGAILTAGLWALVADPNATAIVLDDITNVFIWAPLVGALLGPVVTVGLHLWRSS